MKGRVDFIDRIRGLMILWMLVVHISLNYGYITYGVPFPKYSIFSWMSFFMVPFFFFSGYFFKPEVGVQKFFWKKIRTLLIPYAFYTILGGAIYELYLLIAGEPFRWNLWRSVYPSGMPFYNTPMWFFVCLFSVNVFYYLISKFPTVVTHIIVGLCFAIGWLIEGDGRTQILMHRPFFLAVVYFHLGYVFHNIGEERVRNSKKVTMVICLISYVLINLLDQQCLWFVGNFMSQGNYGLNLLFSLSATLLFFLLFLYTIQSKVWDFLQVLGRYSLVIFASHRSVLNYIYEPAIRLIWPSIGYYAFLLFGIVVLLLSSFILFYILKKIHPLLVGAK